MTPTETALAAQVGICEYCKRECCNRAACAKAKGRVNLCERCRERLAKIHAKV